MSRSGVTGFTLVHEAQAPEEFYYQAFFRSSAKRYIPCLSGGKPGAPAPDDGFKGNAAGYLLKNLAPSVYDFYLCGAREMIREVTLLVDERFAGSLVYREVYY